MSKKNTLNAGSNSHQFAVYSDGRPVSCINFWSSLLGIVSFFVMIILMRYVAPEMDYFLRGIIILAGGLLPVLLIDIFYFRVYRNPSTGLKPEPSMFNVDRVLHKILGLLITYGCLVFFYWMLPEYGFDFYDRAFELFTYLGYLGILLGTFYIVEMDCRLKEPKDGFWHVGAFVVGNWSEVDRRVLAEHARSWLVKGFFFPLMFTYILGNINNLTFGDPSQIFVNFLTFFAFANLFLYSIDLFYASLGYLMTFRALDSHIRSVEPTMMGWVVCILCYQPFWQDFFASHYFQYDDNLNWMGWLDAYPVLQIVWGSIIVILTSIYALSTVSLGYRFSNLTYRGLVSAGPYRFSKHPAYISKCLSWWMVSIPFIPESGDPMHAIQMCVLLGFLSFIYFIRARTEEAHLSNYPEYVAYANWINKNGLLRKLGDWIPYLRYSEARAKSYNSIAWWKKPIHHLSEPYDILDKNKQPR